MSKERAETVFVIAGENHPVRPTFDRIAKLEARFGPIFPILHRIQQAQFGMVDAVDAVTLILGQPVNGGPRVADVQQEVMDNYAGVVTQLAYFITDCVSDPNAPPANPTQRETKSTDRLPPQKGSRGSK